MNNVTVAAVYRHTPEGRTALKFAADLLRQLRGEKLLVRAARGGEPEVEMLARAIPSGTTGEKIDPNRILARNVLSDVTSTTGLSPEQVELVEDEEPEMSSADAIMVDHDGQLGNLNVLVPFDEEGLSVRGEGPLLVPFGTDESGLRAAGLAIPLAALLGREVVFYHTTWRNRSVSVPDPDKHMCEKAKSIAARLQALATAAGVKHRTVIETAQDVVLGTIRCAVRECANLIVMSREPKIIFGSYVDRTLLQSVVPMLIVGKPGGTIC